MKYAYRVYKNSPSNPIYGGTVTADNMESASQQVINNCKITVFHEIRHEQKYHYFMLNGNKVGILIYLNPEQFN